jgi:hypothetical protein
MMMICLFPSGRLWQDESSKFGYGIDARAWFDRLSRAEIDKPLLGT